MFEEGQHSLAPFIQTLPRFSLLAELLKAQGLMIVDHLGSDSLGREGGQGGWPGLLYHGGPSFVAVVRTMPGSDLAVG